MALQDLKNSFSNFTMQNSHTYIVRTEIINKVRYVYGGSSGDKCGAGYADTQAFARPRRAACTTLPTDGKCASTKREHLLTA